MKKWTIIFVCAAAFFIALYVKRSLFMEVVVKPAKALYKKNFSTDIPKKKIVVFTSPGGQGHQSATAALMEYFGNDYKIEPVYLIQDVLGPLDFVYTLTFGNFYSEQFYNYCLEKHHIWLVNIMVWAGLKVFKYRYAAIKELIKDYLIEQEPDVVISVIPMVNGAALEVTHELNIPFWVIPTDLDPALFFNQISNDHINNHFLFNVSYKLPDLQNYVSNAGIPNKYVSYAGFPVRKQFMDTYDSVALKDSYGIPPHKQVIMLMMGGLGINELLNFAHEFTNIQSDVHCLICIGRNESLRKKLEDILRKGVAITYSIVGFTPSVAPLMAMADILITKSGGATINEALYMGLPMIVDGHSQAPGWEYYNRTFIEDHGCGIVVKDIGRLSKQIDHLLQHPNRLAAMKKAIQQIPRPNAEIAVRACVASLVQ